MKKLCKLLLLLALFSGIAVAQTKQEYCNANFECVPEGNGQQCETNSDCQKAIEFPAAPAPTSPAISLPTLVGILLIILLIVAGYAAAQRGKPTAHWRERRSHHGKR